MKRTLKIVGFSILGIVLLLVLVAGAFIWKARFGINFYDSSPPELPADFSGKTVMVFSKTNGFRHGEAIEASIPAFEKMARDNGWVLYFTDNGAVFNPEQLQKFDLVVWNNCSGKVLDEEQRENFKDYMENGGGYVGIHSSGDSSHQWDWYAQNIIGTLFSHHTLHPQFQRAPMILEEGNATLTKGLPAKWEREEEWYIFFDNPRDKGFDVLYTVDDSNMDISGGFPFASSDKEFITGEDRPIVWYNTLGKGRIFYSALGHAGSAFEEPEHLQMLENAMRWAGKFEDQ